MLMQADVAQVRSREVSKKDGVIAVTMRYYPRGLRRDLVDYFISELAPDRDLIRDFKKIEKVVGHEAAFQKVHFWKRFRLSDLALEALGKLAEQSRTKHVYLVCQCKLGDRCHREFLMRVARARFGVETGVVANRYDDTLAYGNQL